MLLAGMEFSAVLEMLLEHLDTQHIAGMDLSALLQILVADTAVHMTL
jgi:hypothetical protein